MLSRRARLIILLVGAMSAAFILLVRYTSIARLEAVTLNNTTVNNPWGDLGFKLETDIVKQPLERLTDSLIAVDTIFKVEATRQWPHSVHISVNEFETCAWLIDSLTGEFYGVDPLGRLLPGPKSIAALSLPVLTGIATRGMYRPASDPRLPIVLPAIMKVRSVNPAVFPLLAEVDFSSPDYLTLSVDGLPYRVRVAADKFDDQFSEFVRFMGGFDANLTTSVLLDMRYSSMIVSTDTLTIDTTDATETKESE